MSHYKLPRKLLLLYIFIIIVILLSSFFGSKSLRFSLTFSLYVLQLLVYLRAMVRADFVGVDGWVAYVRGFRKRVMRSAWLPWAQVFLSFFYTGKSHPERCQIKAITALKLWIYHVTPFCVLYFYSSAFFVFISYLWNCYFSLLCNVFDIYSVLLHEFVYLLLGQY